MRTIAHLSDIHFGRTDPAIVEALMADIRRASPSLIVLSGDLTQRARAWQYRAAADFIAGLDGPRLVVPGNHDIPFFNVFDRFLRPLKNYRRFITDDLHPVYQDDEMIVAGLNTARSFSFTINGFWKDGRISRSQLQRLAARLRAAPANLFKVVVTHHPFIPPPHRRIHGIVLGARRALAVMQDCGVDLLLAGHLHLGYSDDVRTHHEQVARSMLSVQAGTAASTRRRGESNTYNLITLEPDRIGIDVRRWNERAFVSSTVEQFKRRAGTWIKSPAAANQNC